jgi:WD40 repeat protein
LGRKIILKKGFSMKQNFRFYLLVVFLVFQNVTLLSVYGALTYSADSIQNGTLIIDNSGFTTFYDGGLYEYNPPSSMSMIKIIESDVIVDFNKIGISNRSNLNNIIAIEIGWTPAELAADSTRVQPKNITIKNVVLNKFDCGILVHQGVKRVFFENININNSPISIVFAGTSSNEIEEVKLSNTSVLSDKQNQHDSLVALKTLVETTYGYGFDYFNKLIADPNNGNVVDVYSYYGLWLNNVATVDIKNLLIKDVGYNYKVYGSAGNGNRTQAIGSVIKNCKHIMIDQFVINDIYGEINAIGLLFDNNLSITISNSDFSFNVGGQFAAGIQLTNQASAPYSIVALKLEKVNTHNNLSDNIVKGMDLSFVRGLMGSDLSSKFNNGAYQSYGLYVDAGTTVNIKKSTFSENSTTRTTNDLATTNGIAAYGFYGNNINGMQILNVDFNNMEGLNSAYGVYLNSSSSILFSECQFVANRATQMRSGEAVDIRTQQDAQEISKHAPVVAATSTGAYGAFLTSINYVKFQDCLANSNTGHRAIGLKFNNCRSVAVYDIFASTQYATGFMIDTTFQTDNIANPSAIEIKPAHIPLLFAGQSKTTIDALTTTDLFLQKMSSIRASQIAGNRPSYSDLVAVNATASLLEGMLARYRLWGVGIGIQAHNVSGFLLKNCSCAGNLSLFDSGIGICFTGRNTYHTVTDSNLVFNIGSLASVVTKATNPAAQYSYSYNLMGIKPFWSTLLQTDVWANISNTSLSSAVNAVAISPNGNYLAVGLANNDVKILNPNTGTTVATLTGHAATVTSVVFSPDGTKIATASASGTNNIKIWQTSDWTNTQTLTHTSTSVNALAWNPTGTELASGATAATDNIMVWQVFDWSTVTSKTHSSSAVFSVVYSPDGTILATGADDTSNNIKIWATSGWSNTQTLSSHTQSVTSLAFNPAGTYLASASKDDSIKIWNTSSWTVTQTVTPSAGDVNSVAFKNDGKLLASAHADNSVRIWSTVDWSSVKTFTDHTDLATSLTWSADGRRIVSGGLDGYAKFYSTNIFSKATTTTQAGIYNPSVYFTIQGQKEYGNESSGNDIFVRLKSQDRALISPVGPVGAGLIMGDLFLEGVVQRSNLYGNLGNSGNAFGALLDNAYSVTLDSNLISGNIANVYGSVFGIKDRTAHSPNLFMKNFLEGNKCSTFNNSNYFVPFNPADTNNLSLPLTEMMNGKFSNLTTAFDNIEMLYSQNAQFYSIEYLASTGQHPDLVSYWNSQSCWA